MSSEPSKKMKKVCKSIEGSMGASDIDAATQKNLENLDVCQIEIDNLNVKASEEILKIEQKYNQLRKPFFEKRGEIIKNIPNFWFTTIMNHPDLSSIIDEKEEECLQFLSSIETEEFEDIKSGYKIEFHFEENPFFENTVLTKEFHLDRANSQYSKSTEIKWKENNDLTKNSSNDEAADKNGRKRKLETKSFFGWFCDNVDPVSDDIAEIIKEDVWQNPLQYYLVPDTEDTAAADGQDDSEISDLETMDNLDQ